MERRGVRSVTASRTAVIPAPGFNSPPASGAATPSTSSSRKSSTTPANFRHPCPGTHDQHRPRPPDAEIATRISRIVFMGGNIRVPATPLNSTSGWHPEARIVLCSRIPQKIMFGLDMNRTFARIRKPQFDQVAAARTPSLREDLGNPGFLRRNPMPSDIFGILSPNCRYCHPVRIPLSTRRSGGFYGSTIPLLLRRPTPPRDSSAFSRSTKIGSPGSWRAIFRRR